MMKKLGCFLLCLVILTACTSTKKPQKIILTKDGFPAIDLDVSHIPNAVPKHEPLSRYGNPASYTVWGKKYYLLPHAHAKKYKARGVASWYGTKFHRKRTSSGEPYNMFHMTAAHPRLPIPSYAQVTNLENGKKIVVKINDRGPFKGNRIIDLSYVAAKKLGITGRGTGFVQVEAIHVAKHDAPKTLKGAVKLADNTASLKTKASKPLYLQVGSFSKRSNAEKMVKKVKNVTTHPVKVIAHRSPRRVFKVQIGPLKDLALSKSISKQLRIAGLDKSLAVITN